MKFIADLHIHLDRVGAGERMQLEVGEFVARRGNLQRLRTARRRVGLLDTGGLGRRIPCLEQLYGARDGTRDLRRLGRIWRGERV